MRRGSTYVAESRDPFSSKAPDFQPASPQFRLQHQVVLHEHVNELLREVLQNVRIAVGNMGDEVNEIPKRNNTGIRSGRGRGHEDFAVGFILVVLSAEIFNIRPEQRKATLVLTSIT